MTAAKDSRPTTGTPEPIVPPSGGDSHASDQPCTDTHGRNVAGIQPADRQSFNDTQRTPAVGTSSQEQGQPATRHAAPTGASLVDPALALTAAMLHDIEEVRKANSNRLGVLTRSEPDKDGKVRGFRLNELHPDVKALATQVEALKAVEHGLELQLCRQLRRHPLGPWVASIKGVGEKTAARLLGVIGDPYIAPEREKDGLLILEGPRTVSALWAYCGLHVLPADQGAHDAQSVAVAGSGAGGDPGHGPDGNHALVAGVAARRRKNVRSNWSTEAKMRTYLIAEACVKQNQGTRDGTCIQDDDGRVKHADNCGCSPYRRLYDDGRRKYSGTVHAVPCPQCKTTDPGAPLKPGHQHARAMRLVMKEVLKDLWREAKRLHETENDPDA